MLILAGAILVLFAAASCRLLLAWLAPRAAGLGLVDVPGGRKDHVTDMPLVGGLAIMATMLLVVCGGLLVAWLHVTMGLPLPNGLAEHAAGLLSRFPQLSALFGGALLLAIVGWRDDRRAMGAWTRLGLQALAASLLVLADLEVTLFLPDPWMHAVATVLFVVFLTNATNFIDNMNGLMGGVTALGALHLAALGMATGQLFLAAFGLALAASLLAWLPSNFPTARTFMGDAGSTSIGFLLAGLTIAAEFHQGAAAIDPVILPCLLLTVPLVDGITVIVSRLLRGVHPFTAGHDHLSHRLVARGVSRRKAVHLLWILAWIPGAIGVTMFAGGGLIALLLEVVAGGLLLFIAARGTPEA